MPGAKDSVLTSVSVTGDFLLVRSVRDLGFSTGSVFNLTDLLPLDAGAVRLILPPMLPAFRRVTTVLTTLAGNWMLHSRA